FDGINSLLWEARKRAGQGHVLRRRAITPKPPPTRPGPPTFPPFATDLQPDVRDGTSFASESPLENGPLRSRSGRRSSRRPRRRNRRIAQVDVASMEDGRRRYGTRNDCGGSPPGLDAESQRHVRHRGRINGRRKKMRDEQGLSGSTESPLG